jgi:hypothetical protein
MPSLADARSLIWSRLETEMQERLTVLRAQNDLEADPIKTSATRGRIAEVKRILSLGAQVRSDGEEQHPSDEA